jgi:molybdopterin converting factor small subunit
MNVRIKLFAVAKELAGNDELLLKLPEGATIADVERAVIVAEPALAKIVPHSLWAIGTEYVAADAPVTQHADIALIPPVSGG